MIRSVPRRHYRIETATVRLATEKLQEVFMHSVINKLPIYVLSGVWFVVTAPRSVRRLTHKLVG